MGSSKKQVKQRVEALSKAHAKRGGIIDAPADAPATPLPEPPPHLYRPSAAQRAPLQVTLCRRLRLDSAVAAQVDILVVRHEAALAWGPAPGATRLATPSWLEVQDWMLLSRPTAVFDALALMVLYLPTTGVDAEVLAAVGRAGVALWQRSEASDSGPTRRNTSAAAAAAAALFIVRGDMVSLGVRINRQDGTLGLTSRDWEVLSSECAVAAILASVICREVVQQAIPGALLAQYELATDAQTGAVAPGMPGVTNVPFHRLTLTLGYENEAHVDAGDAARGDITKGGTIIGWVDQPVGSVCERGGGSAGAPVRRVPVPGDAARAPGTPAEVALTQLKLRMRPANGSILYISSASVAHCSMLGGPDVRHLLGYSLYSNIAVTNGVAKLLAGADPALAPAHVLAQHGTALGAGAISEEWQQVEGLQPLMELEGARDTWARFTALPAAKAAGKKRKQEAATAARKVAGVGKKG